MLIYLLAGLTVVLDAHSNQYAKSSVVDAFDGFMAKVGQKHSYPLMNQEPVILRPGSVNFVAIAATSLRSDESIKNIDISKRRYSPIVTLAGKIGSSSCISQKTRFCKPNNFNSHNSEYEGKVRTNANVSADANLGEVD